MNKSSQGLIGFQGGARLRGQLKTAKPGRPLISVITVVKNGAGTLERAIGSVLAQRYAPLEYVVCDGGSRDGTLELLRRYDSRIDYWYSQADAGLYEAMNLAVQMARGEWLLFLGADDTLQPGFSLAAEQCLVPNTIYYGDVFMPRRKRRYDGQFSAGKLARKNICHQSIFYPRAVFDNYQFDPRYRVLADWVLNMRCRSDAVFRFQYVPAVIAEFNDSTGVSSRLRDREFQRDYLGLVYANFSLFIFLRRLVSRTLSWPLRVVGLLR